MAVYRGAKPDKNAPTTIEIVSSQSPFKRLNPESDEGRAKLQTRIDAMAEVFVNTLARNRGIEATQVLEQFGGGDILIGAHAVNAGLADRIGSLEKLIAEFSASSNPALQRGFLLPATTQQKETAMNLETLAQEHPELLAQVQSDARASERSRIQTILASEEAKDRGDLAQHLSFATDMAADSAVAMLAKAPKIQPEPKTNGFDAAMRDLGNPKITLASAEAEEDSIDSVAKRLAAAS